MTLQKLIVNKLYLITNFPISKRNYIYEGDIIDSHMFFQKGTIKNQMIRILIDEENLKIIGNDVEIKDNEFALVTISKDKEPGVYSRLEKIWEDSQK